MSQKKLCAVCCLSDLRAKILTVGRNALFSKRNTRLNTPQSNDAVDWYLTIQSKEMKVMLLLFLHYFYPFQCYVKLDV